MRPWTVCLGSRPERRVGPGPWSLFVSGTGDVQGTTARPLRPEAPSAVVGHPVDELEDDRVTSLRASRLLPNPRPPPRELG